MAVPCKKITKNPLNYNLWKVKKIHGDSVKNESARAKQLEGGGAPPACLGLKKILISHVNLKYQQTYFNSTYARCTTEPEYIRKFYTFLYSSNAIFKHVNFMNLNWIKMYWLNTRYKSLHKSELVRNAKKSNQTKTNLNFE